MKIFKIQAFFWVCNRAFTSGNFFATTVISTVLTYAIFFQEVNINPHLKPIEKIEDLSHVQNSNAICNIKGFEKIFNSSQCMCFAEAMEAFDYSQDRLNHGLTINNMNSTNDISIEYFNVCWA